MSFFPIFTEKSRLHAHILSRERPFSKKTHCSQVKIYQKTFNLSKTLCFDVFFLQFFSRKTPAFKPIFGQKNGNCVKNTLYYGLKKSIKCHYFLIYTKVSAIMPIFCRKNVLSLKAQ